MAEFHPYESMKDVRNLPDLCDWIQQSAAYEDSGPEPQPVQAGRAFVPMLRPKDRTALARDLLPSGGVGAELGVRHGDYSAILLAEARPRLLHLVDAFQIELWGTNGEQAHQRTSERFATEIAAGRVVIAAEDSIVWLKRQAPSSLDWVYIDSSHEQYHTQGELLASYRAVKEGGWICGHDLCPVCPGVVLAVEWFCGVLSQTLAAVTDEPEHDWHGEPWQPKRTHLNSYAIQVEK
jgi:hypothetical protein